MVRSERRSPWQTALISIGVIVGVLVFASAASLAVLLWTEWGRARVCAGLNSAISSQIAGTLEVTGIDALSLSRVRAHGIKILAPDGKPAIEAEHAEIEYELSQLWSKKVGWTRAVIDGCHVRVTEYPDGRINMEETFKEQKTEGTKGPAAKKESSSEAADLDLQTMVTSHCKLVISGGSLPTLRMVDLAGIMRVHVPPSGETELRFDEYRGTFADGLPTGVLHFRNVAGTVQTGQKRLLHFDGQGRTSGAEVDFKLDIFTEPTRVVIGARFPEVSSGSLRTRAVAAWSKLMPKTELSMEVEE